MSYPGKGNISDVLKVNAQNNLSYQQIPTQVTVASGSSLSPTYQSAAAALNAGEKNFSIIGDTFETSQLAASGATITLTNNALWDLQDNSLTGVGQIDILGNGRLRYNKTIFDDAVSLTRTSINDIDIINDSSDFSPIVAGVNSRISDCIVTGDLVLSGSGTIVNGCSIRGSLIIMTSASGCNIQQSHIISGLVVDSGNNTVLSNVKFN